MIRWKEVTARTLYQIFVEKYFILLAGGLDVAVAGRTFEVIDLIGKLGGRDHKLTEVKVSTLANRLS